MRATLGRIAVVALLSFALCGCKSGPSMFAWGKKKDDMSEAPKYAGSPTLPSAGQTPGTAPTNVNGTVAAGTPTYNSVSNPTTNSSYASQSAGYQQSPYPTTPYPPATISQAGASTTTGMASNPAATPSWAGGGTNSVASSGPTAYNNTAPVQPQQGQYDPAYGTAGSPAAQSYAAASNPSAYGNTAVAPPPAAVAPPSDYRTADARSAQTAGAYNTSSPVAAPAASAGGSNRYGNLGVDGAANVNLPANAAAMPVEAPLSTPPPATNYGNDRYGVPSSSPPASAPPSSPYGPTGDVATPPAATNGGAGPTPTRPESNWRPGNTSSITPGTNTPRPGAGENLPESSTPGRVMPASYETAANATTTQAPATQASGTQATHAAMAPAPMTPPNAAPLVAPPVAAQPIAAQPSTTETYGTYQGSAAPAQTSSGTPSAPQSGQFGVHAW